MGEYASLVRGYDIEAQPDRKSAAGPCRPGAGSFHPGNDVLNARTAATEGRR